MIGKECFNGWAVLRVPLLDNEVTTLDSRAYLIVNVNLDPHVKTEGIGVVEMRSSLTMTWMSFSLIAAYRSLLKTENITVANLSLLKGLLQTQIKPLKYRLCVWP